MLGVLVRKLWRDVRWALLVTALLLCLFQCLWARITDQVSSHLLKGLSDMGKMAGMSEKQIEDFIFQGPGRIIKTFMGGDDFSLFRPIDLLSISYVHPFVLIVLCIWAIGRASTAIVGELDRGTLELLLAQPIPRWYVPLAHFIVDCLTIPILCLSMWIGNWLGAWMMGIVNFEIARDSFELEVNPFFYAPAMLSVAMFIFAVSGYVMWISSMGRFRTRVVGVTVLITILQLFVNVFAQLWEPLLAVRPWTVFHYFQPQPMIRHADWYAHGEIWMRLGVLAAVGVAGYALATWTFCKRDLPAPL